jgi:hypothetical protein
LFESLLTGAPTVDVSFHPRPTDHSSLTFVRPAPGFIEALLASSLRLVPRREDGSHLLHRGSIIYRQWVVQRGTDSACTRVRREAGKGAGDDADYARVRRRLAVPLGSNVRRVRCFTFSTLQLRGLMGESELMIAR